MSNIKSKLRGFTLTELTIVLVILGVIAGLAVPTYNASVEQNRGNEAKVNLNAIYMGEKIFALNNAGAYWVPGGNQTAAAVNTGLDIDINPQYYTTFTFATNGAAGTFKITAIRNTTEGGVATTTHYITNTGSYDTG